MSLRDITIGKSQEVLEIENLMSGESEKTPDILHSEIEILVEEMTKEVISLETACSDLISGEYGDELLNKYEELNNETAVGNFLIDNWLDLGANIIDRIIAFIKKLYGNIIVLLKKFYVKFLVLFNKQKTIAIGLKERLNNNKDIIQDKLGKEMTMYVNEYGYIDVELYNNIFNNVTLTKIVNKLKDLNRALLLAIPSKGVYSDVISDGRGPLNDMVNQYQDLIFNKYIDLFFKSNRDTNVTLNKNIILTNISNNGKYPNNRFPFILTSNGMKSSVLDISEKGLLKVSACEVVTNNTKKVMNIDTVIQTIDDLYKYEIKNIVENDFKLLDIIKRDSDAYLNQSKRYNKVDTFGISMYANNVTTTLNIILNYSINRMEITENILKLFKGL